MRSLKKCFTIVFKHPVILVPFIMMTLIQAAALYITYLFPQKPVSLVLAPIIKTFFKPEYLAYPSNLFFLMNLFNTYVLNALSCFPGVILAGYTIIITGQIMKDEPPSLYKAFRKISVLKALTLIVFWILGFYINKYSSEFTAYLIKGIEFKHYLIPIYIPFFVSFMFQSLIIFASIAYLLTPSNMFESLFILNFKAYFKSFFAVIAVFVFCALIYTPVIYLMIKTPKLMNDYFLEFVIVTLSLNLIMNSLINFILSLYPAILFCQNSKEFQEHIEEPEE